MMTIMRYKFTNFIKKPRCEMTKEEMRIQFRRGYDMAISHAAQTCEAVARMVARGNFQSFGRRPPYYNGAPRTDEDVADCLNRCAEMIRGCSEMIREQGGE